MTADADLREIGIAVGADPLADGLRELRIVELAVLLRHCAVCPRLEGAWRRSASALALRGAVDAPARLRDRLETRDADWSTAALAKSVASDGDLHECAVDLLEGVTVALANTVQESIHRLQLAALFDFGLADLLDGSQIVFDTGDFVEERALPGQKGSPEDVDGLLVER
jgi:hypothetical protein